jgi:hypothetical protein
MSFSSVFPNWAFRLVIMPSPAKRDGALAGQGPKEERAPPINAIAPDDIVFKPRTGG